MLTRFIVVITLQNIQILNHYVVYLQLICYMSIIPQSKKKEKTNLTFYNTWNNKTICILGNIGTTKLSNFMNIIFWNTRITFQKTHKVLLIIFTLKNILPFQFQFSPRLGKLYELFIKDMTCMKTWFYGSNLCLRT